jgi:hypothetical protein
VATRGAFVAHVSRVVMFLPLQDCISIRISMPPSKMGDACSPHLNVELSTAQYCDDNYMDGDDYLIVMAYLNQYWLDTFACLE